MAIMLFFAILCRFQRKWCRIMASPTKSCRLDPVPTFLLKKVLCPLVLTINKIVNLSLSTGTFPAGMKHAMVTPLLKNPTLDASDLGNYRPVSNLSFLSKLIERIVTAQLMDHLATFDVLPPRQPAYRTNHSTETALIAIFNDLLMSMDQDRGSALLLLDLIISSLVSSLVC